MASEPHLDLHFSQVGQLLEDPSGFQDGDVVVIQSPTGEGRRSRAQPKLLACHSSSHGFG